MKRLITGIRKWLATITLAKLLLLLLLAIAFHLHPFAGSNAVQYYLPIGHRIALQGQFNDVTTRDDSSVSPGYPFLLGLLDRLDERHVQYLVVVVQVLADWLIAGALLSMGRALGVARAGGVAAVIWLVYPPAAIIATWIAPETVANALLLAALALLIMPEWNQWQRGLLGGLLFGVSTLFRTNALLLPCFLVPLWLWKRCYRTAIAFSAMLVLVTGAWLVRNYLVLQDPIVSSTSFGSAFLEGSDERFYHERTDLAALMAQAAIEGLPKPATEKGSAINRWLFQLGVWNYKRQWHEHGPLAVAAMLGRKLVKMWYLTESGGARSQIILLLCSLLVAPLGFLGCLKWWKSGDTSQQILSVTVAYLILVHLLVVPLARYLLPALALLLLAACSVTLGVGRQTRKGGGELAQS